MLDLVAVAEQLGGMRAGMRSLADELAPRLDAAVGAWGEAAEMGADLRERVRQARTSWLVAEPVEPLGTHDLPATGDYRVVAADGSQIFPDRHELVSCYLLNVGVCDIDYASGSADLSSEPSLHWAPDDVYPLVGGVRQEADARVVGARRFAAECDALRSRLHEGPRPTLGLVDGTLLLWWLEPDPERLRGLDELDVKTRTFAALERLAAGAEAVGALVAGYLSAPRATDVVSMLKVVLCTEDPVDCDRCPYDSGAKGWTPRAGGRTPLPVLPEPGKPCEEVHPITDAALFSKTLVPGRRSSRFRSQAKVATAYGSPIDFVYLHTGDEIARVEFPASTTPDGLETLLGCVADQCRKGYGYPVALAEAHEQAVVRAADRRAFLELLRRGDALRPSAKLARKRTGVL